MSVQLFGVDLWIYLASLCGILLLVLAVVFRKSLYSLILRCGLACLICHHKRKERSRVASAMSVSRMSYAQLQDGDGSSEVAATSTTDLERGPLLESELSLEILGIRRLLFSSRDMSLSPPASMEKERERKRYMDYLFKVPSSILHQVVHLYHGDKEVPPFLSPDSRRTEDSSVLAVRGEFVWEKALTCHRTTHNQNLTGVGPEVKNINSLGSRLGRPGQKVIFQMHGGGYCYGTAAMYRNFNSFLTNRTGYPVFAVEYPLCPETYLPDAVSFTTDCYVWLLTCMHVLPEDVIFVGDSAGGGMALLVMLEIKRRMAAGEKKTLLLHKNSARAMRSRKNLNIFGREMCEADTGDGPSKPSEDSPLKGRPAPGVPNYGGVSSSPSLSLEDPTMVDEHDIKTEQHDLASVLDLPCRAALIAPWTDVSCDTPTGTTKKDVDAILYDSGSYPIAEMIRHDPNTRDPRYSPVHGDLRGLPPLLLHVGTEEQMLDDVRYLHQKAELHGVKSCLKIYPGMFHVFHLFHEYAKESLEAMEDIAHFIATGSPLPMGHLAFVPERLDLPPLPPHIGNMRPWEQEPEGTAPQLRRFSSASLEEAFSQQGMQYGSAMVDEQDQEQQEEEAPDEDPLLERDRAVIHAPSHH